MSYLTIHNFLSSFFTRVLLKKKLQFIIVLIQAIPIADGKPTTMYIGRCILLFFCRSCSAFRVQLYRTILVAVKELLPQTLQRDVLHEANMLIKLYLPYLLGICTSARPLRIVTQASA